MSYSSMTLDELKNIVSSNNLNINLLQERIDSFNQHIDELEKESSIILEITDRYEITDISNKSLQEQTQYFFCNKSHERSLFHIETTQRFFDILKITYLKTYSLVKTVLRPDFIKQNFDDILIYLPVAFEFTEEFHPVSDVNDSPTNIYHEIGVYENPNVKTIFYYPNTKLYKISEEDTTFTKLEDLLNYMMENNEPC